MAFPFARMATRFAACLSLILGAWITLNFVQMAFNQNDFTGDADDVPFDPPQSFLISKGIATLLFASAGLVGLWGTFVKHKASLHFFSVVSLGSMMFSVSSSLYDFVLINKAGEICAEEFTNGTRTHEKMEECTEELNEQRIIVIYTLLGMVIVGVLASLCSSIYLAEIKRTDSNITRDLRRSHVRQRATIQRRWSVATLPAYSPPEEGPKENAPSYHSREEEEPLLGRSAAGMEDIEEDEEDHVDETSIQSQSSLPHNVRGPPSYLSGSPPAIARPRAMSAGHLV